MTARLRRKITKLALNFTKTTALPVSKSGFRFPPQAAPRTALLPEISQSPLSPNRMSVLLYPTRRAAPEAVCCPSFRKTRSRRTEVAFFRNKTAEPLPKPFCCPSFRKNRSRRTEGAFFRAKPPSPQFPYPNQQRRQDKWLSRPFLEITSICPLLCKLTKSGLFYQKIAKIKRFLHCKFFPNAHF